MPTTLAKKYRSKVLRQGLSIVEFVGCLVALCGGVAMGSMYLGIDLLGIATDAIHSSQVMDLEESALSDTSEKISPSDAEEKLSDQSSVSEQGDNVANSEIVGEESTSATDVQEATTPSPSLELTEIQKEQATQSYWHILTSCVQVEVRARHSGMKNLDNWQLLDHLNHRLEGHQSVVDKLEQLDEHGVDQKVTMHAKQVLTWHLAGIKLNQRALDLITNGPKASLNGPVAQSWQSAATQHRMEEKLIQEKHLGVASYLSHIYSNLGQARPASSP